MVFNICTIRTDVELCWGTVMLKSQNRPGSKNNWKTANVPIRIGLIEDSTYPHGFFFKNQPVSLSDIFQSVWTRSNVCSQDTTCEETSVLFKHWLKEEDWKGQGVGSICLPSQFLCESDARIQLISFSMRTLVSWIYMYIYKYILNLYKN